MTSMILKSEAGETFGADPRKVGVDALNEAGHHKRPILRAIRANCMECCGDGQSEVRNCTAVTCNMWPYRMGTNPFTGIKGNVASLKSGEMCGDCGKYPADPPSGLCPGCEAYRDHTA